MFKWSHKFSKEVDIPMHNVWDFYSNPSNWPKWIDQFEYCGVDGELKNGSVIAVKIKDKNMYIPIVMKDIRHLDQYVIFIKAPFFAQESCFSLREVLPGRTCISIKSSVTSIFTPFIKPYFQKKAEYSDAKSLQALVEAHSI